MDRAWVVDGLKFIPLITAGLLFLLLARLQWLYHPERIVLRTFQEFSGFLKKRKTAELWYQRTRRWLIKNGAVFHYGKRIEPMRYLSMRIVLAAVGFVSLLSVSIYAGMAMAVGLFFLPGGMLLYLNGKDNERLLPELKLVYHALDIQIRAGVYIMDALTECYGSVQDKRLRAALLALASDIVVNSDAFTALEQFQEKFDNRYIDSLCLIILQALESGQALELLGDIGEQIKDMEETVLERKKSALDRSVTFYQLGILAAVLGISLYACVTHMMEAAVGF